MGIQLCLIFGQTCANIDSVVQYTNNNFVNFTRKNTKIDIKVMGGLIGL